MITIAENADVELSTTQVSLLSRSIHLPSEFKTSTLGSILLRSTEPMKQLFETWWNEFERKHAPSRPDNIKLMMMFKSQNLKPKTQPFECKDDEISSEPMK